MFRTKQLAMTTLVAVALSQPFVCPAYSAPAISDSRLTRLAPLHCSEAILSACARVDRS
jgi:hypothetical protein